MNLKRSVEYFDLKPKKSDMMKEVLYGLSKSHKSIPSKFLYDEKGSEIFEKISELAEYYPTRVEKEIFKTHASSIGKLIGKDVLIVEPGAGNSQKVKLLLKEIRPLGYVPIEISIEILLKTTAKLYKEFPRLNVIPVCADFTRKLHLPLSFNEFSGKKNNFLSRVNYWKLSSI